MSKIFKKFVILFFVGATLFLFTGCFDAIYQSIREEITLNDPIINGYINSLVRYTGIDNSEYLFVQNGRIYRKRIGTYGGDLNENDSHDEWSAFKSPEGSLTYEYFNQKFNGEYICKIATDENYLYALSCTPDYDEESSRNIFDSFTLYCWSEAGGWQTVPAINTLIANYMKLMDEDLYMMDLSIQLFCTNAPKKEHRKAFVRIGGGVPYEIDTSQNQHYSSDGLVDRTHCTMFALNGSNGEQSVQLESGAIDDLKDFFTETEYVNKGGGFVSRFGAGAFTQSAVWFKGEVRFMNFLASCTNETKNDDPTYVYFGDGHYLRSFNPDVSGLDKSIMCVKDVTTTTTLDGVRMYQCETLPYKDALLYRVDAAGNLLYSQMSEKRDSLLNLCATPLYSPTKKILAVKKVNIDGTFETESLTVLEALRAGYNSYLSDASADAARGIVADFLNKDGQGSTSVIAITSSVPSGAVTVIGGKTMRASDALVEGYSEYLQDLKRIQDTFLSGGGSADDSILSIAYSKDAIYVGTDESGAYKARVTDGVVGSLNNDNDDTKYASQMDDPYVIRMIFCTDPSLGERDYKNSFYSSMQFYYTENNAAANHKNTGLWAYYPRKDGWNKE